MTTFSFPVGAKLIVDYDFHRVTGSCWLSTAVSEGCYQGRWNNHCHYVDGKPEPCGQLLRLLKQNVPVLSLSNVIDWRWPQLLKVRTDDGLEGWVSPIFLRHV